MSPAAPPIRSPFATIREVARVCRVTPRTVHRMVAAGELPVSHFGGRALVRWRDVEAIVGPLGEPSPESD